jgi:hypothetical protein
MEPIIVSNQAEYDEAIKTYRKFLDTSYYDLDKGTEPVKEAGYFINNYLNKNTSRAETEKYLSRTGFNESQAKKVIDFFSTHWYGDIYDLERGFNFLGCRNNRKANLYSSPIHIKNATEKISVLHPVEAFGESEVEAFGYARVTAHDTSRITANDRTIIEALDNVHVTANNQSHIVAKNHSSVFLYGYSSAAVHDNARLTARESSKISVFDHGEALILDEAYADAYNNAFIAGKDNTRINAFNDATVKAFDMSRINAGNASYIEASEYAAINAQDQAVVVAGGRANVTARHNSLVLLKEDAHCQCKDAARMITASGNIPVFLKRNALHILDHPFINRNPAAALNLLLVSANPKDADEYSRKLKEMGCVNPESTKKVLQSWLNEHEYAERQAKETTWLWER